MSPGRVLAPVLIPRHPHFGPAKEYYTKNCVKMQVPAGCGCRCPQAPSGAVVVVRSLSGVPALALNEFLRFSAVGFFDRTELSRLV